MLKLRCIVAILTGGVLLAAAGVSALAADVKAAQVVFGTVDFERAFDNYNKKQQHDAELKAFAQQLNDKLELRKNNRLLSGEEFKQLLDLKYKPKQSDDDKKKIDELLAVSKALEQELAALQQKQSPTDEERARLKELQDKSTKTDAVLKQDEDKYEAEFNKQRVDLSREVMLEVKKTIADMAKAKGLSMVFNKSDGEIGLILYSSIDITDEVLKKLNNSK